MEHKEINFDEYIRQDEPELCKRAIILSTTISLQEVDGLTTSEYLRETACAHIEGKISRFGSDKTGSCASAIVPKCDIDIYT